MWFLVFCCLSLISAAPSYAESGSPGQYQVRKGDSLGLIAQRFGVSVAELRQTNHMSTDVLQIGQELRLAKPFHRLKDGAVQWEKPSYKTGAVLRPFGPYKKKGILMPSTGADMACDVGTAISNPGHGVVRHIGHMDGFGTLIIIEHAGKFATVLSPLDPASVVVEVGHALLRGDHIGRTGPPPDKDTPPYLHIELRKNDKAIKPDPLLHQPVRLEPFVDLRQVIRDIPDFPKPGIMFKDITPVMENPAAFRAALDGMKDLLKGIDFDAFCAIESRGFVFGAPMGQDMDKPLVLMRKAGKLPAETRAVTYDLEYGQATLEMHVDSIEPGDRVIIVDDLLATGGTAAASAQLVTDAGGIVVGFLFMVELEFLAGRAKLEGQGPVFSLVNYS